MPGEHTSKIVVGAVLVATLLSLLNFPEGDRVPAKPSSSAKEVYVYKVVLRDGAL